MATATMMLQAQTPNEMEAMINGYIAQGYAVANRTPNQVTLIKRKEFSILWLVIGLILCLIPLFIYLIIYASESDKMVVINLGRADYAGYQMPGPMPGQASIPQSAPRSPDGNYWWDGQAWQPITPPSWPQQ